MLIPLSDPIWSRLYGPYGVQDVAGDLGRLSVAWDRAVAKKLFWDRLHHQESLYPATYAALPWLRAIAQQDPNACKDVMSFLSWVIYCALYPRASHEEPLAGLALDLADHQLKWLPKENWLSETDLPVLRSLSEWADEEFPRIAEDCITAIKGEEDRIAVSHLAWAPLSIRGAFAAARALEMFVEGEEPDDIRDMPLSDTDFDALHRLSVTTSQSWIRDLAFQLDGKVPRPDQDELPL